MTIEDNLATKREEEARNILVHPDETLPGLMFSATGRIVHLVTRWKLVPREKQPYPWYFNALVLALVIQLPTLALSILFRETAQMSRLGPIWMLYIELSLLATVLAYIDVKYLYENLDKYILGNIDDPEQLKDLGVILARAGSVKYALYFMLFFTPFWSFSFSLVNSVTLKPLSFEFIGFGLFAGTVVFGILVSPALYMLVWVFFLIGRLGTYTYELNETSPAHSEVIQRLSRIFSNLLYSIGIFMASATFTVSYNPGAIVLTFLVYWIPLTIFFIVSQGAIYKIVTNAKWRMLGRIQQQINELNARDITDKNNIESINRLMDYFERIRATPNSTFNLGTGLNFLNQLALPLLGFLLANLEKVIHLFPQK